MSAVAQVLLPVIDTSTPEIRASLVRFREDRSSFARTSAQVQQLMPPRGGARALIYALGPGAPAHAEAPTGGCRVLMCVEGEVQLEGSTLSARLGRYDLALLPSGAAHSLRAQVEARVIAVDYIRFPAFRGGVLRYQDVRPTSPHPILRLAPSALQRRLSPGDTRLLVGPRGGMLDPRYALEGPPHLVMSAICTPAGEGPELHVRARAHEAFVVLSGCFEVVWGDRGEHREVLRPFDAITIPPGVNRSFRNIGEERGCVLPIMVGANSERDDIAWLESMREELLTGLSGPRAWFARQVTQRVAKRARAR